MSHTDTSPVDIPRPGGDRVPPANTNTAATPHMKRHEQVAAVLRQDIELGTLLPGQQLLTIDELREHFRCGPQIVLAAYRELERDGLIVRRHGVGVFVAGDVQPAFHRVRDALREKINGGTYKPGDQLPSGKSLTSQFNIGSETLALALSELKAEGLVEARGSHGTFVAGAEPQLSKHAAAADIIRGQITDGTFKPGDRIPPEVVLAQEHGLSASSMGRALNILKDEGLVVRLGRSGTYVATLKQAPGTNKGQAEAHNARTPPRALDGEEAPLAGRRRPA